MNLRPTRIDGVVVVEADVVEDERGAFTRLYDEATFATAGLVTSFPQHSRSDNARRGTLRGLHYQRDPHGETKVVRCLSGRLWDVVVDLRPGSPTYAGWFGIELAPRPATALYIPTGCAHGFVTLEDDTSLLYLISTPHVADAAAGVRWDDPTLGIEWPLQPAVLSERDRGLPTLPEGPRSDH